MPANRLSSPVAVDDDAGTAEAEAPRGVADGAGGGADGQFEEQLRRSDVPGVNWK